MKANKELIFLILIFNSLLLFGQNEELKSIYNEIPDIPTSVEYLDFETIKMGLTYNEQVDTVSVIFTGINLNDLHKHNVIWFNGHIIVYGGYYIGEYLNEYKIPFSDDIIILDFKWNKNENNK